jgi:methanogenic corrinoid protein MtbC1
LRSPFDDNYKPSQKEVVDFLNDMGIRKKYKVIVEAAPVAGKWAEEIGADAFGDTAEQAVKIAQELITQR